MPRIVNHPIPETVYDRSIPEPNTGCWLWLAQTDKDGYGRVRTRMKQVRAHRFSYEVFIGPVGPGKYILHKCDNPYCVNPEHLFSGTHQDNIDDKVRKGRHCGWRYRRERFTGRKVEDLPRKSTKFRERSARRTLALSNPKPHNCL